MPKSPLESNQSLLEKEFKPDTFTLAPAGQVGDTYKRFATGNLLVIFSSSLNATANVLVSFNNSEGIPAKVGFRVQDKAYNKFAIKNPGLVPITLTIIYGHGGLTPGLDNVVNDLVLHSLIGDAIPVEPNTNSLLGRLQQMIDCCVLSLAASNDLLTRFGEVQATPTANTLLGRLTDITRELKEPENVGSNADVSVAAGVNAQLLSASPATRRSVWIQSLAANAGIGRIRSGTAASAQGIEIAPGEKILFETNDQIRVFNPTGAALVFGILKLDE